MKYIQQYDEFVNESILSSVKKIFSWLKSKKDSAKKIDISYDELKKIYADRHKIKAEDLSKEELEAIEAEMKKRGILEK